MRAAQLKVAAFMTKHGLEAAERPSNVGRELARHRHDLMAEELREYVSAAYDRDIVKTADALADLVYTVLGTAVAHGIDLGPVFDEVHRSNMTKEGLDPATRKGGKGDGYEPPRISDILIEQLLGKRP